MAEEKQEHLLATANAQGDLQFSITLNTDIRARYSNAFSNSLQRDSFSSVN
jgi:hypothetical protein